GGRSPLHPGVQDGSMPGADWPGRQFQSRNKEGLAARRNTKLIDAGVQNGVVEPRHELPRDPELDPFLDSLRFPGQFFAQFASKTFLGRFARLTPSAKARKPPRGKPRVVPPRFP